MSAKSTIIPALPGQRALLLNIRDKSIGWNILDVLAWEICKNSENFLWAIPITTYREICATPINSDGAIVEDLGCGVFTYSVEEYIQGYDEPGVTYFPPLDTLPPQYRAKPEGGAA